MTKKKIKINRISDGNRVSWWQSLDTEALQKDGWSDLAAHSLGGKIKEKKKRKVTGVLSCRRKLRKQRQYQIKKVGGWYQGKMIRTVFFCEISLTLFFHPEKWH